jgi:hypothetical protein
MREALLIAIPLILGALGVAYGLGERAARKQIEQLEEDLERARKKALANLDR